jgi:hypothetical protein
MQLVWLREHELLMGVGLITNTLREHELLMGVGLITNTAAQGFTSTPRQQQTFLLQFEALFAAGAICEISACRRTALCVHSSLSRISSTAPAPLLRVLHDKRQVAS